MSWSKLSDDFSDDCWTLSDQAFRTHVEGLVWSNRKLLDCRIPKADVRRFAKHPEAVAELVDVGWWSDEGDHYLIRHHARYQREKEQVLKIQQRNQKNGATGGRPAREQAQQISRETQSVTQVGSQMETQRDRTGQARPLGRDLSAQAVNNEPALGADGWPLEQCQSCGEPMQTYEPGQTLHPGCPIPDQQRRSA